MAEDNVLKPGEVKPGKSSTEHKLSWASKIVGVLMIILGVLAEAFGWSTSQGTGWGALLMMLGTAQSMLAAMGYTGFRSLVKMNAQKSAAIAAANSNVDGPSGNG